MSLIAVPKDSYGKQNSKSNTAKIIIPTGRDNNPNGIIFQPVKHGGIISPLHPIYNIIRDQDTPSQKIIPSRGHKAIQTCLGFYGGQGGVWSIPPSLKHQDHTIKLETFNTVILERLFWKPKELLARRCAISATFLLQKTSDDDAEDDDDYADDRW